MTDTNNNFPKTITLSDGSVVEIRMMSAADRDSVLSFAQNLSEEDLLFLRVDITQPEVVDDWMRNLDSGHSTSLAAYDSGGLIGYATVHRNPARWTRSLGEIRVNVSAAYRARGLGKILISEIFAVASGFGLRKLTAHMTADQQGAQAAFRRLGFVPEAILADYVEDSHGMPRDLVIMTYDIAGHSDTVQGTVAI